MNDPYPPDRHPPRANPIQPDKPGSGQSQQAPAQPDAKRDVQRQKEQSDAALDNVRSGYD